MPSARRRCSRSSDFEVERHPVPDDARQGARHGLVHQPVVRERFGSGGPDDRAATRTATSCRRARAGRADPYGAEVRDGLHVRPRRRGVEVRLRDLRVRAARAEGAQRREARRHGRAALHLRRGSRRRRSARRGCSSRACRSPTSRSAPGFSYGVTTAHNGCLHLEVEVTGQVRARRASPRTASTRSRRRRGILNDLYAIPQGAMRARVGDPGHRSARRMVVGLIAGGINTNVVPDKVVFRLDRRIIPEEIPGAAERFITALIRESVRKLPGIKVDIRRILLAEPVRAAAGPGAAGRTRSSSNAREVFGDRGQAARRAALHRRAPLQRGGHSRPCSTAPGRARSRRRTATAPTRTSRSTTCTRRPRSSR